MREIKSIVLLLLSLFSVALVMAHSVTDDADRFYVEHAWKCGDKQWACSIDVEKSIYHYYKQQREHTSDDYMRYILSDFDRGYIANIVANLRDAGQQAGYTDFDNVRNVVAFVQSLRYVSDLASTGKKEYVRYPLEMLVDGCGDCEDRVVLIAAILHEMNYELLLVSFTDHLALAIQGEGDVDRGYYEYQGKRYYYLETTGEGWEIGVMPDRFVDVKAELIPIVKRPIVYLRSYEIKSVDYNSREVTFKIVCGIENTGPTISKGMSLNVQACAAERDNAFVFSEQTFELEDFEEGRKSEVTLYMKIPRRRNVAFSITLDGDNFNPQTLHSRVLKAN